MPAPEPAIGALRREALGPAAAPVGSGLRASPGSAPPLPELREGRPPGLLRRLLSILRHVLGLALGALVASTEAAPSWRRRRLLFLPRRAGAAIARRLVRRSLRNAPWPVQLRSRLELLGPTYIKLGQVLSLRQDLLPADVTTELGKLLDRLPALPGERFLELVEEMLPVPVESAFVYIDPQPLASASIAQIHRATTLDHRQVVLKMVKPGIRETLRRDARILQMTGSFAGLFLGRYRPRRVIDEFIQCTAREVDLRLEADHAEIFSANFSDDEEVVFPKVLRQFSTRDLLCLEYLDGFRPDSPTASSLPEEEKDRIVSIGARAMLTMLYRDGFFHADLHPANLLILPGPKAAFLDLGMVGRFDDDLRRVMLYYFYCLVRGDVDNAARYLASVAEVGPRSDLKGFRRALAELGLRWRRQPELSGFSLAQLMLRSVGLAGKYRVVFPVELVLMVRALVTFEAVGSSLVPGLDVAQVSRGPLRWILLQQLSPLRLGREGLAAAPDLFDAVVKAPLLITETLKVVESYTRQPRENPLAGLRGTLLGAASIVSGAILAATGAPWPAWASLFGVGLLVALRRG
ncbi:MAG: AarF/UbiB family protein [Acidobacteriota bacterium]